ncbi:MAG: TerB family tellurite resistance protein [Clostridium sp.]|nr:TerB family tellurite resistance protein [Clostridium sp.]
MFLFELKNTQKELFLDLSIYLSMSDGEFADSEKNIILQMCKEMGIKERFTPVVNFDDALNQLAENATIREKRIILLEIVGVILVDGVFAPEEESIMRKISNSLAIDYSQCEKAISIVQDLYKVYSKVGSFLTSK